MRPRGVFLTASGKAALFAGACAVRIRAATLLLFSALLAACAVETAPVEPAVPHSGRIAIEALSPTIYYKWSESGEAFQVALLDLSGASSERTVDVATRMAGRSHQTRANVPVEGASGIEVLVPSLPEGGQDTLEVTVSDAGGVVAEGHFQWKFQRQWKLHLVPFSHTDVGFTNTQAQVEVIQKLNIDGKTDSEGNGVGALDLFAQTDELPSDSRFRLVSDSSWPVVSFFDDPAISQERKDLLVQRIREGRFEVTGFYIGHTNKFMSDEALVRSTMFANERLAREHGIEVTTAIINDVGDASSVVVPLARAGLRYFQYGENTIQYPLPALFYLRVPQGDARGLMWRTPGLGGYGEKDDFNLNKVPFPVSLGMPVDSSQYEDKIAAHLEWLQKNGLPLPGVVQAFKNGGNWHADYPYDAYLMPFSPAHGGDNGNQDLTPSAIAADWNSRYAYPRLIVSTSRQFFEYVEAKYADRIPEIPIDFAGYWGEQVFLAAEQMDPKKERKSREFVEQMSAGEAFSTFASSIDPSVPYPAASAINEAYSRNILLTDHNGVPVKFSHNMCPENGVGGGMCYTPEDVEVFKETRRQWIEDSHQFASSILTEAQAAIASRVRRDNDRPRLIVFNSSAWPRTDAVEATIPAALEPFRLLADGSSEKTYQVTRRENDSVHIVFIADVPSFGYRTYEVSPGAPPSAPPLSARSGPSSIEIENDYYRITVPRLAVDADSGKISHLYDKLAGIDLVNPKRDGLNQYILMMRSQSSGVGILGFDGLQQHRAGWFISTASLMEDGPVRARIRVTGTYNFTCTTPPLVYAVLSMFKGEAGLDVDLPLYSPITLTQDIILYKGIKRVEFVQTLENTPPQVLENTFAYSFNIPGWQEMRVEMPYNVVRYGAKDWAGMYSLAPASQGDLAMAMRVERDQYPWNRQFKWIEGIPTDVAFRHFVDLSGPDYGVAFSSRDSGIVIPMQPGATPYQGSPSPKFYHLAVGNSALGAAIAGSDVNSTYTIASAITTHPGAWNTLDGVSGDGTVARWARAFTSPLTAVWVDAGRGGYLPPSDSFASVDQPNVVMPIVKMAEDGDGYVLRLLETAGRSTFATVRLPFAGRNLTWTLSNTAERDTCLLESVQEDHVSVLIGGNDLLTLRVRPGTSRRDLPVCVVR